MHDLHSNKVQEQQVQIIWGQISSNEPVPQWEEFELVSL